MRLAKEIGAKKLQAYCDSQLVANQFSGEYVAKNDRMDAYLKVVQVLAREFDTFALTKIPRSDNSSADALAALASTSDPDLRRVIPVESIGTPNIDIGETSMAIVTLEPGVDDAEEMNEPMDPEQVLLPDDWREEIRDYIHDGKVPTDRWAARRLKAKSAHYMVLDGNLFRRSASGPLMICVSGSESRLVMEETHSGAGGNHSVGRALAMKIKKNGHFWPTMIADCEAFASKCEPCQ
ncbi:unnamed protein product [Microthlaspi erraticum]|uniref:RNase H type-1 domain-containing protein n=1 Tax=Microthlaspi erraticum TaxID=1685480 RepID=A0A6D2J5L8_9BRAS|nr:unnamed protein product [Microthlaspi erraticum]